MKEFHRPAKEILTKIHEVVLTSPQGSRAFKVDLARVGIEWGIPPSEDYVQSFYLCVSAALNNTFHFNDVTDSKKRTSYTHAQIPAYTLCSDLGTQRCFGVYIIEMDEEEKVSVGEDFFFQGSTNDFHQDVPIVCLLKRNNCFSMLGGLEYFSENKELYFLKISEYLCSYEFKSTLQQSLAAQISPEEIKRFILKLINDIYKTESIVDLEMFFRPEAYLFVEFKKRSLEMSSQANKTAFMNIKRKCLSILGDCYDELYESQQGKIKAEIELRAAHLRGVHEKKQLRLYFQQPVKNTHFHSSVLDYMTDMIRQRYELPASVFQSWQVKQLNREAVLYYGNLHNLEICLWKSERDTSVLTLAYYDSPPNPSGQLHVLEENNHYFVLEENSVLQETVLPNASYGITKDNIQRVDDVLVIKKNSIFLSEIILPPEIKELRLYAEALYIDADLDCPGVNVVLSATKITVSDKKRCWIHTSGRPSTRISKVGRDGELFRQNPAKPFGLDGEDGECGEPGGSAGHIYIEADVIENLSHLQLELNGGKGADGGNGGKGDEGRTGKNGKPGENTDKMSRWDFTPKFSIKPGTKAEQGQDGGNGGCGGKGGCGGNPGTVKILCSSLPLDRLQDFEKHNIQQIPGEKGKDGKGGEGGLGGLAGEDGKDHAKAWQSNLYIKERIRYGCNLEKIEVPSTYTKPPIDFIERKKERLRSRAGKNGDELTIQHVARLPQVISAPLRGGDDSAATLSDECSATQQLIALHKEKEEVHGVIEKMLSRMQGRKQKVHHTINAPLAAEKKVKKPRENKKPLNTIDSIIDENHPLFQKTKTLKNALLGLYADIPTLDFRETLEGILEWVEGIAKPYFPHIQKLLEQIHEDYHTQKITLNQLLFAVLEIRADIRWLDSLNENQISLVKKFFVANKKNTEMSDKYDGLMGLYALRTDERKTVLIQQILDNSAYAFFHPVAKKAFAIQCCVKTVLVHLGKDLSCQGLTALSHKVYSYLDSSIKKIPNETEIDSTDKINLWLEEIFQFVPEPVVLPDALVKQKTQTFSQQVKYVVRLHQKAREKQNGKKEFMLLIQQYVASMSLRYFQGFTKNHCEMLCRLLNSPLIENLYETIFPQLKEVIDENRLKKMITERYLELLNPREYFLHKFVLKDFPDKSNFVKEIIEHYPPGEWAEQLQHLSKTLLIEKISSKEPRQRTLHESLENAFSKAIQQDQYEYWLKSIGYCLRKPYLMLNNAFVNLMSEVDDKEKLFEILTHTAPENWVKNLLLQCISEYLDVFIGDKQRSAALMAEVRQSHHDIDFLMVLNAKLREELTQIEPSLRISENILTEIMHVISRACKTIPSLLPELHQRPLFTWSAIVRREEKIRKKDAKLKRVGDAQGKERSLATLIELLKLKNTTPKIKVLIDQLEQKIEKIIFWREKYETLLQSVEAIQAWCRDDNHLDPEWITANKEEVIAVMSIAIRLTSAKNSYPYSTQYIALLILLEGGTEGKGLLGRVATNEGKTLIAGMFALYHALRGECVDVVTSSSELAKMGAERNRSLFESMNVTVSTNCSEACRKNSKARRHAYQAQVVYGDLASFEHDYLLSTLHKQDIVGNRHVDAVLIDEVDNMLLDKSEHVLYLSHEMPDLHHLRMCYVTIWNLYHATHAMLNDPERKAYIKKEIESRVHRNVLTVPACLQDLFERRLSRWIDNAFIADRMSVNDTYTLCADPEDSSKDRIVIMDKDTGVEQFNMTWEYGLHQFLELKHQKRFSHESLKSVFISNFSYFKKFSGKIYGFSGTLGSEQEQALMSSVYDVEFFSLPRLKPRQFNEEDSLLVENEDDEEWRKAIQADVLEKIKQGRPVLVLCENRDAVKKIKHWIQEVYPQKEKIYAYSKTIKRIKFLHETHPESMQAGDILIATNLAGRGADIGVDDIAVKQGGLHEILTYMPPNRRIEKQDFARVARRGEPGTARFIIKSDSDSIDDLKQWRDLQEEMRLEDFRQSGLFSRVVEEALSNQFGQLSDRVVDVLRQQKYPSPAFKNEYIQIQLKSLQDEWAVWFDKNSERIKNAREFYADLYNDYNDFDSAMRKRVSNPSDPFKFVQLPHELIRLGIFYSQQKNKEMDERAIECFNRVIETEPHYAEIAHYYLAHILSRENQRRIFRNQENDPAIRQQIVKELKSAYTLLEKRKEELGMLGAMQNATIEAQRVNGVGLSVNEFDQQLLNESKLITIHLNAIKRALGEEVDESTFLALDAIKNQEHLKKLFESVTRNQEIMKLLRVSKKVKITPTGIVKMQGTEEQKIDLPVPFISSQEKILAVLHEKSTSDDKSIAPGVFENPAIVPVLVNLGVIKPTRVKLSLKNTQTKKEIEERLEEIKKALATEVKNLFEEEASANTEVPADTSSTFLRRKLDKLLESRQKEETFNLYLTTVFEALKRAAGELKTIPQFKIELADVEKYFSTGELPPEIRDFQERLFDKVLSLSFDKSLWSWEAFAVAMFGVAQIAGGVALQVATYGIGALAGGVLIAQGIGDILFAIQSGLCGTFTWEAYFKQKAKSLVWTLAFAGIGGAIAGVFTAGSGLVTLPGVVVAKQICTEVSIKLATTVGCALAFKGLEQIAAQLPALISSSLSEKVQATLTQKLVSSPVLEQLKSVLNDLYKKIGVDEGNKKFAELCAQIESDHAVNTSFLALIPQIGCDLATQVFQVLEQINIGNGMINWVLVGWAAKFFLESCVDVVTYNRLITTVMQKVEALPAKLREYTNAVAQSRARQFSTENIQYASDACVKNFQTELIKKVLDKVINTIIRPRLEGHMNRAFRQLSTTVSSALQSKYSYSSKPTSLRPVNSDGGEVDAAPVTEDGTMAPAPEIVEVQDFVPDAGNSRKDHSYTSAVIVKEQGLFKHHYHKHPHHTHHDKLHPKPPSSAEIATVTLSTGTTIINVINSLHEGITAYRLACIEQKKLEVQLQALRVKEEAACVIAKEKLLKEEATRLQEETSAIEKNVEQEIQHLNYKNEIEDIQKRIEMKKIEKQTLNQRTRLLFISKFDEHVKEVKDSVHWLKSQLTMLNEINKEVGSGSVELLALFTAICEDINRKHNNILGSPEQFLAGVISYDIQELSVLEVDERKLREALKQKENSLPIAANRR